MTILFGTSMPNDGDLIGNGRCARHRLRSASAMSSAMVRDLGELQTALIERKFVACDTGDRAPTSPARAIPTPKLLSVSARRRELFCAAPRRLPRALCPRRPSSRQRDGGKVNIGNIHPAPLGFDLNRRPSSASASGPSSRRRRALRTTHGCRAAADTRCGERADMNRGAARCASGRGNRLGERARRRPPCRFGSGA